MLFASLACARPLLPFLRGLRRAAPCVVLWALLQRPFVPRPDLHEVRGRASFSVWFCQSSFAASPSAARARAPGLAYSASACTWALRAAAAHCALALLPHPALVSRGCLSEAPVSNRLSGAELPSQVFAAELCARALLRGQVVSTPFRACVSCDIRQLCRAPRARAAARISGFSEPAVHILTALRGC